MTEEDGDRAIYVVSDLHIGGDEQIGEVDFEDELMELLQELEDTEEDAELVVNGDAFGLWEFTDVDGPAKFEVLEEDYSEIFQQLKATGENIEITLIPGNHDHELSAYPEYRERFREYNVDVVQEQSIERDVGDGVVHFEHGNQQDPNNYVPDWGNPYVTPLGYYYNTHVTSRAGKLSKHGKFDWLSDVQAVTPTQRMPNWLASKYFYVEMHPALRYSFLPFLLLFNVSLVLAGLAALDVAGVWSLPADTAEAAFGLFGRVGETAYILLYLNLIVVALLTLTAIPIALMIRDIRRTVERFGLFETDLTVDPEKPYRKHAEELFRNDPEKVVFCYGHTHRAKTREVDGGYLVNTGTWLKRLHRIDVIAGRLPPVFYPTYQLNAVRFTATEDDDVHVEYLRKEKDSPADDDLTLTERLLTLGRRPDTESPEPVVVDT